MIAFGAGIIVARLLADYQGAAVANTTPVRLGALQDISLDGSVEMKTLYGAQQYPLAVGKGKGKIELKAKHAEIDPLALALFLGKTPSTSIRTAVFDAVSAIPTTPFQVTIAPPSSGTFTADLGVYNNATGVQFTRVASAPATGQYSVSGAGVYTFAAADTGVNVRISYEYTATVATAKSFVITNDLMGATPYFECILVNSYGGSTLSVKLNKAVSGKLSLPFKNDDFTIQDFEAEAFADSAGNVGQMTIA